jgi:mono/diheme cytochrome c family protein
VFDSPPDRGSSIWSSMVRFRLTGRRRFRVSVFSCSILALLASGGTWACNGTDGKDSAASNPSSSGRSQAGGTAEDLEKPGGADGASETDFADAVTAVSGPSWLHHLGVTVDGSPMGRMGGTGPAAPTDRREPSLEAVSGHERGIGGIMQRFLGLLPGKRDQAQRTFHEPFDLTGEDLYRLNCRSCHGPDGEGSPPDVNSLIGPVQGTAPDRIQDRMAARGRTIPEDLAVELAAQAKEGILDRLQNGGEKMPPFRHLRGEEVEALFGYLRRLAEIPETSSTALVRESAARVGEHLTKGTCHVCHDATGPGGHHATMMRGIIPSLTSFPRDYSLNAVIHQARDGSSEMMGMMGRGMMSGGGRETMPPLPYLTEAEVAAAYFYLEEYPPQP